MKKIVPAIIITLSVGIAHAETIVNVTKIAGKSQKEVAAYSPGLRMATARMKTMYPAHPRPGGDASRRNPRSIPAFPAPR